MSWSAKVTHISERTWGPPTPLPTEHIPKPFQISVDFFSQEWEFVGRRLQRWSPRTPCCVRPYFVAMHYHVNQNSTAHWSLYVPPVVTICTTSFTFNNSTFCPHSVFMCFVWIWEQTAIISLYSINWLVFITETVCLLRGTDWAFIYNSGYCSYPNS